MKLYIQTLGNFDITYGGQSKNSDRSYKLYRLLQYFITHRDKKLLPETIIDNLYQDSESSDPKNVLRTQIHRLKQNVKKFIGSGNNLNDYMTISMNGGYYSFELGRKTTLDINEFEANINLGKEKEINNVEKALEHYKKALELYKGSYLSANPYENWLVPIRNRYNILYIKTFYRVIEIMESMDDNYGIIGLCEEALIIEPYEETIHISLMDAMLRIGQVKNAMSHYMFITTLLSKELGIRPSPAFKNIYRKIQSYYDEKSETSIENIKLKLEEKEPKGALLCDYDYFRFLYNIEKRKGLREGNNGYISLISFNGVISDKNEEEQKDTIRKISSILNKILRKGDVFSFWNDNQILLMLHGSKEEDLVKIENRIRKGFNSIKMDDRDMEVSFKPLIAKDSPIKID